MLQFQGCINAENPIKIEHTVPEMAILVMLKTIKYKGRKLNPIIDSI